MDRGAYDFKLLETQYAGFRAPTFEIKVGSFKIDSSKIPVSSISVEIDAGTKAGGCRFVIESQYDYEKHAWANNLLDRVEVGAKLSIKAGYHTQQKKIFFGYVDEFTVEYAAESAPRITVTGIDAKGYLMNATDDMYMSNNSTHTVVTRILNECVKKGYAKSVKVGMMRDYKAQLIQSKMNDYKFICTLAELFNMNFFVVNGEIIFDNMMNYTLPIIHLSMGTSLMSFTKTMSLKDQVGKVVVFGIDPKTLKPIKGEASDTSVNTSGKEPGDIASEFEGVVEKRNSFFAQTPEECTRIAQAIFDTQAFAFVSGSGRCIGIPELIPGRYVKLTGFDNKSSDTYFISKVTHEFSQEGYYTNFSVKGAKSK